MSSTGGGVWQVDWLNANSQRKYPLHDSSTGRDGTESVRLPDDLIVDAFLSVNQDPAIDPALFHIINVSVFADGITVSVGYDGTAIGSVSIDLGTFTPYSTFYFQGSGDFFDTIGKLTIGQIEQTAQLAGSFTFNVAGGGLSPTVVKPDIRGVNAIFLQNGVEISDPIQGDIVLEAGRNALLILDNTPADYSRIIFNFIDGAGTVEDCDCRDGAVKPAIKTINGIAPDSDGNFVLEDDPCLKLEEIPNGLKMAEKCATPCCGCEELAVVKDRLEFMLQQINSLDALATRLDTQIGFLQINCIGG